MCWHREDNAPPSFTWTLTVTSVNGATVRHHVPAGAIGLVVLFDGGGGGSVWFRLMENRLQVEALVDAGYAVAALDSAGPSGDYDMTADPVTNQDLVNVDALISLLGFAGSDVYYLGFSSGGAFASLATVFTPAKALALFNVRGVASTFSSTVVLPPPTLWVVGRNDQRIPPTDAGLVANWAAVAASGVDWAFYVNEPAGLVPEAFERISDPTSSVSPADSADAVADLQAGAQLDACGVPVGPASAINWAVVSPGPSFTADFQAEAQRQVNELYGSHVLTSDFRQQVVDFFVAHP
ncbi:alpha/beta hydrolase [Cellulomonas septica]|uniref:Alpha/beta hydrolase n=1 Tax=Cellulomonas septica TaxID=285080 RepID=A0ABX1JZJ9_9CELL|nr:alpha/beta hydrolase [Cellulomonas septica]NKY39761.1 alpha/beta hydrolase [Cellulomonas septica]